MQCETSKPTCSAAKRERELYRYYQPDELVNIHLEDAHDRKSSSDPILTAFAQLGALRLKTRRGMISLASCTSEYVIAEAGPSLSLQKDNDENDVLWHGIGKINCKDENNVKGLSTYLYESDTQSLVVNDLTQHEMFKDWKNVRREPHIRFMAAVPLRTPNNIVIGNYMVMDTQVRNGLTEDELQFMYDVAITVVDYLQGGLVKRKQHRAETMIKAMGLFIEGKSTLREWWLAYGHKGSYGHRKRSSKSVSLEALADEEFGVQERTDTFSSAKFQTQRPTLSRTTSSNAPSVTETDDFGDGRPPFSRGESLESTTESSLPVGRSMSSVFAHDRQESVTSAETHSVTFDVPEHPNTIEGQSTLQDAVVSGDLKSVFARASNLIREACGVDGMVYYDASVGSFGGSANEAVMNEKPPGVFAIDKDNNESEEVDSTTMFVPTSGSETESSKEKCCNILGFSTRNRSSLGGHSTMEQHRKFPESALRRMMKKYPHGKLFNFDENGHVSSDSDYLTTSADEAKTQNSLSPPPDKGMKRKTRVSETESLLRVFPGARSIFFFPLWDSTRDRWYSGSFIWSTSPTRVLCPTEDLVYLASFGNSVMAEVARISQQALAQMKTDFIASISHELRSPLHGVLASVEFLQETKLDEMQTEMVDNINASGKVLLDTINHVLDYSKVNRKGNKKSRFLKRSSKRSKKQKAQGNAASNPGDDLSNICQFSEEVIESVYAGHRVKKHAFGSHNEKDPLAVTEAPVSVIVDIAWRPDWSFDLDPGAWRRILMNLFNNSMKYTASGFVKVSLHVDEESSSKGRQPSRTLILKVSDSGKGISEEFLKHQLYRPFAQEDGLASGAGLGLSIIRHIIQDLGGRINITSEPGSGTEAIVKLPLPHTGLQPSVEPAHISESRKLTTGLTYALESFERYPDISEEPTGILPSDVQAAMYLKAATSTVLHDWFCMKPYNVSTSVEASSLPDIVVVSEAGLAKKSLLDVLHLYSRPTPIGKRKPVAIVLCSTYHPTIRVEHHQFFDVFHMQQPYGPNKLASLLTKVLQRPLEEQRASTDPGSLHLDLQPQRPSNVRGTSQPSLLTSAMTASPLSTTIPSNVFQNVTRQPAGLWSKGAPVQSTGLWSPKSPENTPSTPAVVSENAIPVLITPPEGLRILLVEDNEINLKLLVAYMRKLKLEHATAGNGLEALNAYKSHDGRHDVIFMDISMPVMDGIESSRNIRRFERENSLPPAALIALTGAANPNARQEAFSSGVDLFLTKPVAMKHLKVMLEDIKREGRKILRSDGYDEQG